MICTICIIPLCLLLKYINFITFCSAFQLFYRLHASILKILLSKHLPDTDYELFERFVNKAARSPFACAKQKNEESVERLVQFCFLLST
jgi:hypothetical protein